jgi:hypothetical protein
VGVLKRKAHVFVISDFMDQGYESLMRRLSKKHDAVAVVLADKLERELPKIGLVDLEDPETGEIVAVDTNSPVFRREYKAMIASRAQQRDAELRRAQTETIFIETDSDLVTPLLNFFKRRKQR